MYSTVPVSRDDGSTIMCCQEGAVLVSVSEHVFFNPKQTLQRDLSLLAMRFHAHTVGRPLVVLDAMAGTGVRALRYLLEGGASRVIANDTNRQAVAAMRRSAAMNGLVRSTTSGSTLEYHVAKAGSHSQTLQLVSDDAVALMHRMPSAFDFVDLDPCGSVAHLLLSGAACVRDGGLLCASSTDMGALSGQFGEQVNPLKCNIGTGVDSTRATFADIPSLEEFLPLVCAVCCKVRCAARSPCAEPSAGDSPSNASWLHRTGSWRDGERGE